MKRIWKIIGLSVVLLFAGFALWVFSSLFGNPVEALLAQRTMERYLASTYPGKQFRMQSIHYDMKFHRYSARFVEGSQNTFEITGSWRKVAYDQYRYTYAMDETLSKRFTGQLESALEELLMPRFPQLHGVYSEVYVAINTYPAGTQFRKGMEQETDLEISMISEDIPAEDFAALCLQARDVILQNGYNPLSMRFLLNAPEDFEGKGGMLLYTLKIKRQDYAADFQALLPGVESYNLIHRVK